MLQVMTEMEAPEAGPEDVALTLTWWSDGDGLRGELRVRNVGRHPVRLSGKPRLIPLDTDGHPLETDTLVTLEYRMPGYVELAPGESALTGVGWAGWDGPAAGGTVRVEWPGGQADVQGVGPRQPAGSGPATNLWSSWFVRVDS
jgi:hypothetical protein